MNLSFRVSIRKSLNPKAGLALARYVKMTPRDAQVLLRHEGPIPKNLNEFEANKLCQALNALGISSAVISGAASAAICSWHPQLLPEHRCVECDTLMCTVCAEKSTRCPACVAKARKAFLWKWTRISALLLCSLIGALWIYRIKESRERRTDWSRTLLVHVIFVSKKPIQPAVKKRWAEGLVELGAWVDEQKQKFMTQGPRPSVIFELVDATGVEEEPTFTPPTEQLWDRVFHAFKLRGELALIAKKYNVAQDDARIFVSLENSAVKNSISVEGVAELRGDVGQVIASGTDSNLTLELLAVGHELFHCLGAEDQYDSEGHSTVPGGLVLPHKVPLYPQKQAEIMSGEIATSAHEGRLPDTLDEVGVGPTTARALNWLGK